MRLCGPAPINVHVCTVCDSGFENDAGDNASGDPTNCTPKPCDAVTPHQSTSNKYGDGTCTQNLAHGDSCQINCLEGYYVSSVLTCTAGELYDSNGLPQGQGATCEPCDPGVEAGSSTMSRADLKCTSCKADYGKTGTDGNGHVECELCEHESGLESEWKFNLNNDASQCNDHTSCVSGFGYHVTQGIDHDHCEACIAGTFSDGDNYQACVPCAAGHVQPVTGQTSCSI